jgi:hypothetical protein
VLRHRFGLSLAPDTVQPLYKRVPKGLDQFVVPAAS